MGQCSRGRTLWEYSVGHLCPTYGYSIVKVMQSAATAAFLPIPQKTALTPRQDFQGSGFIP
jgi:hypothetical protein